MMKGSIKGLTRRPLIHYGRHILEGIEDFLGSRKFLDWKLHLHIIVVYHLVRLLIGNVSKHVQKRTLAYFYETVQ